jgi:hypothetical protein
VELGLSVLIAILVIELYAWLPRISEWLLEFAVHRLRPEDQERCREEWKAQLNCLPNTVVRVIHAFSLMPAAGQINADFYSDRFNDLKRRFQQLAALHSQNGEKLKALRQNFEHYREDRISKLSPLEQDLRDTCLQMNLKFSNKVPAWNSACANLQLAVSRVLDILHTSYERTDRLTEEMIGRYTTKSEEVETMLHATSKSFDNAGIRFRYHMKSSSPLYSIIHELESNLGRIETSIKAEDECPENDEPFAEFNRIADARASMISALSARKPVAGS